MLQNYKRIVNTDIVKAAVVKKIDANLLQINGGYTSLIREWAKVRIGFVKRYANTKSKVPIKKFEKIKSQFNFDISKMKAVPNNNLRSYWNSLCSQQ